MLTFEAWNTMSEDSDNAALDGIHDGPLTPAELRAWRRQLRDQRRVTWLRVVGWKALVFLATIASGTVWLLDVLSKHWPKK